MVIRKNRVIIIVLDGAGVGALPDAINYGDQGSNTLGHILSMRENLHIPNLVSMGLKHILDLKRRTVFETRGAFGKMAQLSSAKDTTSGHWELAGLVLDKAFPVYSQGFPKEIVSLFEGYIGRKVLGNVVASGTEIINNLGKQHVQTGFPILYTSADSVFQLAAHEEVIPLETLYDWCRIAREKVMVKEHAVARVIARPFRGEEGNYWRTSGRRDFSLEPPGTTLLDLVEKTGRQVWVAGKVKDVFAEKGITVHLPASGNSNIMDAVFAGLEKDFRGLLWATLVDFDMVYGHRNDVEGFTDALEEFDLQLGMLMQKINNDDLLFITADHGCDPTFKGTDHTREYVPLLVYGKGVQPVNLGIRKSFADLGRTVADILKCGNTEYGNSFAEKLFDTGDVNQ